MSLELVPIGIKEACAFIAQHRQPQRRPRGWTFGLAVRSNGRTVGVSTACRHAEDERAIEIGSAGAPLFLATWRAAVAMGFRRGLAYSHDVASSAALLDAGWLKVKDLPPRDGKPRALWEIRAAAA